MKRSRDICIATEPALGTGYEASRLNALRHGILSQHTVLPWEDADEYDTLVAALVAEHTPQAPTEEHLVEELAGILWRKRRLRLAEAAAYRRGLNRALAPHREAAQMAVVHLGTTVETNCVSDAVQATTTDTEADLRDLHDDKAMTRRALDLLSTQRNDAYEAALGELRKDTRDWWEDELRRDPDDLGDAEGLRRFLECEVLPWYEARRAELENRPLIREQAFGEALDPDKLERLGRYEVHLDRKFERTLSTLIKLQALRRERASETAKRD